MQLLPSQKNSIYDVIVEGGFSPLQFDYKEPTGTESKDTLITFKGSKYYFNIHTMLGNNRSVRYSPGEERVEEAFGVRDWYHILSVFAVWVSSLAREIAQPDKWSALLTAGKDVKWIIDDESNSLFNYGEVQDIKASIHKIKEAFGDLQLDQDQILLLQTKLDYIAEKSASLGRVDWKNLFIGTLIGTIVQLAVPPDTEKAIWSLVAVVFKKVILIALQ